MNHRRSALRNERGQGLAIVGMGLGGMAIIGLTAFAVDLAHQSHVAGELQAFADITALAAARAAISGGNATTDANTLAGQNSVNGQTGTAVSGASCTPSGGPCAAVQVGGFAATGFTVTNRVYSTGTFTAGTGTNAVEVNASAQNNNLIGGLTGALSGFTTTVEIDKRSRAAFVGVGSGQSSLPIALCSSTFSSGCFGDGCEPIYTYPSNIDNSAWTGFGLGLSDNNIMQFISAGCPTTGQAGGGQTTAMSVGMTINVTNGAGSNPYDGARCMVCNQGMCTSASPCLVPVFDCSSSLQGAKTVLGFSEVVVDSFHCSGGGSNGSDCACGAQKQGNVNGMSFHSVFRANVTGTPGTQNFGAGFIAIVG